MDEATVSAGVVENHMVDGEAMLIKACKMKNARIAELEAALRKIVDLQPDGGLVAYSWGQEYFRRAHAIATAAIDGNTE
jgi:hypothetical protein